MMPLTEQISGVRCGRRERYEAEYAGNAQRLDRAMRAERSVLPESSGFRASTRSPGQRQRIAQVLSTMDVQIVMLSAKLAAPQAQANRLMQRFWSVS